MSKAEIEGIAHVRCRYLYEFLLTKANSSDNVKADYLSHEGQKDQKVYESLSGFFITYRGDE